MPGRVPESTLYSEEHGAIVLGHERREDVRQKEDGGVQERHHAKARGPLPNQIARQPLGAGRCAVFVVGPKKRGAGDRVHYFFSYLNNPNGRT
jgi:hypothetical protein